MHAPLAAIASAISSQFAALLLTAVYSGSALGSSFLSGAATFAWPCWEKGRTGRRCQLFVENRSDWAHLFHSSIPVAKASLASFDF